MERHLRIVGWLWIAYSSAFAVRAFVGTLVSGLRLVVVDPRIKLAGSAR